LGGPPEPPGSLLVDEGGVQLLGPQLHFTSHVAEGFLPKLAAGCCSTVSHDHRKNRSSPDRGGFPVTVSHVHRVWWEAYEANHARDHLKWVFSLGWYLQRLGPRKISGLSHSWFSAATIRMIRLTLQDAPAIRSVSELAALVKAVAGFVLFRPNEPRVSLFDVSSLRACLSSSNTFTKLRLHHVSPGANGHLSAFVLHCVCAASHQGHHE
jgi:hypothetical protein